MLCYVPNTVLVAHVSNINYLFQADVLMLLSSLKLFPLQGIGIPIWPIFVNTRTLFMTPLLFTQIKAQRK